MQQHGYLIAYQPTAAVYRSHAEPLIQHLRRTRRDIPTILGNVLHIGSGEPGRVPLATQPEHGAGLTEP